LGKEQGRGAGLKTKKRRGWRKTQDIPLKKKRTLKVGAVNKKVASLTEGEKKKKRGGNLSGAVKGKERGTRSL